VVVSNRLPRNLTPGAAGRWPRRNVGGLVSALEPVLAAHGGAWVGWDGAALPSGAAVEAARARGSVATALGGFQLHGVPLSEREVGQYYHSCANRALWPLFHDFPGRAVFVPEDFAAYARVNRRFAEIVLEQAGPRARVWVHDFHLMLVPGVLRELGFCGRLDFFLHIPFPPPEIFRALPWREELLRGMLAADSVAFHIPLYRDNFVAAARQFAGVRLAEPEPRDGACLLLHDGGATSARAVPIGIDVDEFERIARLAAVERHAAKLRELHGNLRILFSADRLDYTKGIGRRLEALERFVSAHPEAAGKFVLIQVGVPSRHQVEEYRQMKREIDREVGRINGEHGREGWMPIHYRYQALEREELVAHYRAADVMLVTPLRDGMNLVASEFAASRVDEDGVLVVSELAGVSERSPGALLVNPYDLDGCVEALDRALRMDPVERQRRMAALRARVRSNPVSRWAERCLASGEPSPPLALARAAAPTGTQALEAPWRGL